MTVFRSPGRSMLRPAWYAILRRASTRSKCFGRRPQLSWPRRVRSKRRQSLASVFDRYHRLPAIHPLQIKGFANGMNFCPSAPSASPAQPGPRKSLLFLGAQQIAPQLGTHSRTLLYAVEDPVTKRSHRLCRHTLGSTSPDPVLYEEPDERFRIEIERTRTRLLSIASRRKPHHQRSLAIFQLMIRWASFS